MSKARELAELGAVYNSGALSNRNLIINGDYSQSQRGDYSSATAISNATYYLDRWKTDISGVSATIEHDAVDLPNGITTKSAKMAATSSATGYMQLHQPIEVQSYMENRKLTVSAYVRSNNSNTRIRVEQTGLNTDGTAHTGGGGWEFLTLTVTIQDGISTLRPGVIMWDGSTISISSGDFLEIAHIQAEFGTEATPFEQRRPADELASCQRYYQTGKLLQTGDGVMTYLQASSLFPVPMRASPTVVVSDNAGNTGKVSGDSTNNIPGTTAMITATGLSLGANATLIGTNVFMQGNFTATAEI